MRRAGRRQLCAPRRRTRSTTSRATSTSHEITFDFHTDKDVDGIHFRVTKEAKAIRFHLHFNGKEQMEHILIGHEGHHPLHNPFALVAHGHGKK